MPILTPNLGIKKFLGTEVVSREAFNENYDIIDTHGGDYVAHARYAVNTAGNDSYTVTIPGVTAYTEGMIVAFKATIANTTACTLNVNNLGAKNIVRGTGTALVTGDIIANKIIIVIYDGTNFQLQSQGGDVATLTGTQTLTNKTLTAPKFANNGYIADSNSNELIKFAVTSAAVNELTVKNAVTGTAPEVQATGGDTNIDINLVPKGTGKVLVAGQAVPLPTVGNITLYVNAATGSDANDGLTSGTALSTPQAAINKLPQVINHSVIINIAAGTYGDLTITGFMGVGSISIIGGDTLAAAVNYKVGYLFVSRCSLFVYIKGIQALGNGGDSNGQINTCALVQAYYCVFNGKSFGFKLFYSQTVEFVNCGVSGNTYGLYVVHTTLRLFDCVGSGNNYGVYVYNGAVVSQYGANGYGKRIRGTSGNTLVVGGKLLPDVSPTTCTLYVRTDGSDDNDGSDNTAGAALRTINEALRRLPPRLDHDITINVAAGNYSDEAVIISGFVGKGSISLIGAAALADTHTVAAVHALYNSINIVIQGIKSMATNASSFVVLNCPVIYFSGCKTVETGTGFGFSISRSKAVVASCQASNRGRAICAQYMSEVYSTGNTGTGNGAGLYATEASTIGKTGTQPGGTITEEASGGSRIA